MPTKTRTVGANHPSAWPPSPIRLNFGPGNVTHRSWCLGLLAVCLNGAFSACTPLLGWLSTSDLRVAGNLTAYPVPSRRMSLTRVMTAAVLGSVLLTGCFSPDRGTSSRAIDTESGPPVMPAEAKELTEVGAVAFARHFFAQRDYSIFTGHVAPLEALGAPTCVRCASEIQIINTTLLLGARLEGTATTISNMQITGGPSPGPVDLSFVYTDGETTIIAVNGATVERFAGSKDRPGRISLVPNGKSWLVSDFGNVGS